MKYALFCLKIGKVTILDSNKAIVIILNSECLLLRRGNSILSFQRIYLAAILNFKVGHS